jgi:Phage integrase, N-terminal SAM-like domain
MAPHDCGLPASAYERRGGKALYDTRKVADTHISPILGKLSVNKLTTRKIENWHHGVAEAPSRLRSKRGGVAKFRPLDRSADGVRKRRATANRVLTVLKGGFKSRMEGRPRGCG